MINKTAFIDRLRKIKIICTYVAKKIINWNSGRVDERHLDFFNFFLVNLLLPPRMLSTSVIH